MLLLWNSQQEEDLKLQCLMMLWWLLVYETPLNNRQHEMQESAHQSMKYMLLGDEWKQRWQEVMILSLELHKSTERKYQSDIWNKIEIQQMKILAHHYTKTRTFFHYKWSPNSIDIWLILQRVTCFTSIIQLIVKRERYIEQSFPSFVLSKFSKCFGMQHIVEFNQLHVN